MKNSFLGNSFLKKGLSGVFIVTPLVSNATNADVKAVNGAVEETQGILETNKKIAIDVFKNLETYCEIDNGVNFFKVPFVHTERDMFNFVGRYFSDAEKGYIIKAIGQVEIKDNKVIFHRFRGWPECEIMNDEEKKKDIFEEVPLDSKDAKERIEKIAKKIKAIHDLNSYLYKVCGEAKGINVYETKERKVHFWFPNDSQKELFIKSKVNPGENYLVDYIEISEDGLNASVVYNKGEKKRKYFFLKGVDCVRDVNFEVKDRENVEDYEASYVIPLDQEI